MCVLVYVWHDGGHNDDDAHKGANEDNTTTNGTGEDVPEEVIFTLKDITMNPIPHAIETAAGDIVCPYTWLFQAHEHAKPTLVCVDIRCINERLVIDPVTCKLEVRNLQKQDKGFYRFGIMKTVPTSAHPSLTVGDTIFVEKGRYTLTVLKDANPTIETNEMVIDGECVVFLTCVVQSHHTSVQWTLDNKDTLQLTTADLKNAKLTLKSSQAIVRIPITALTRQFEYKCTVVSKHVGEGSRSIAMHSFCKPSSLTLQDLVYLCILLSPCLYILPGIIMLLKYVYRKMGGVAATDV